MTALQAHPGPNGEGGTVGERLAACRAAIAHAARGVGRDPAAITLLAVSKTQPQAAIEEALAHGQRHFGENRVQEAAAKFPALRANYPDLRLHLIGHLQTNKARDAVRLFDVIESLDRPSLAEALAAAMVREERRPDLLVEVNLGDEPQKSGVMREAADDFIAACKVRFGAALIGVMGIPPVAADPAPHFAWLAACARRHRLGVISMGMSADFAAAIAAGATEIRLGTAIFGARPAAA